MRAETLIREDILKPNIITELRSLKAQFREFARGPRRDASARQAPSGLHSPYWNFITVAKSGGDFQTITDALIYITDNSAINRYCILIYPGTYDEQVILKSYVALLGLDRDVCIIRSSSYQNLVILDDHTSLNELQIVNEHAYGKAILGEQKADVLIDSCIVRSEGNSEMFAPSAVRLVGCTEIHILGSLLEAENTNSNGAVYCCELVGTYGMEAELRYSRFELTGGSPNPQGVAIQIEGGIYATRIDIQDSYVKVRNDTDWQDGLHVDGTDEGSTVAYVEHTTFRHIGTNANGQDLVAEGSNATIYVRADRYATQFAYDGGTIVPLEGDRPVLECHTDSTAHTITAGAATWQDDANGSMTIDLPCQSNLAINVGLQWRSDTVRATSFACRVLVDGVQAGIPLYAGQPVANIWQNFAMPACEVDLATGSHTVKLQYQRLNAADTVVVQRRSMQVTSNPWP